MRSRPAANDHNAADVDHHDADRAHDYETYRHDTAHRRDNDLLVVVRASAWRDVERDGLGDCGIDRSHSCVHG